MLMVARWDRVSMIGHHGHNDDASFPVSWTVRGALWRMAVSVLAPVAWLSVTLLYLGFWAHALSLVQDILVGVVSVLMLFGALVVVWLSFGVQLYHRWVGW